MALDTALAESAQAFFCAIVDRWGLDNSRKVFGADGEKAQNSGKGISWHELKTIQKPVSVEKIYADGQHLNVNRSGTPIAWKTMDAFLGDSTGQGKGWYESSVKIALLLAEDIRKIGTKFPAIGELGWQHIVYARDDQKTTGAIGELFALAKKNQERMLKTAKQEGAKNAAAVRAAKRKTPAESVAAQPRHLQIGTLFDNINKWSTADIYLTSSFAEKQLASLKTEQATTLDFPVLNKAIYDLWKSGHLLPISLKKVESGKQPHWQFQNIEEPAFQIENVVTNIAGQEGINTLQLKYDVDGVTYAINWRPRVSLEPARKLDQTFSPTSKMLIQVQPQGGVPGGQVAPAVIMEHPDLKATPQGQELIDILDEFWNEDSGLMKMSKMRKIAQVNSALNEAEKLFGEKNSTRRKAYLARFKNDEARLKDWKGRGIQERINKHGITKYNPDMQKRLKAFFDNANKKGKEGASYRHVIKIIHSFATAQTYGVSAPFVLIK